MTVVAVAAVVESVPVSPGMTASVTSGPDPGPGPVGEALEAELRRRGLSVSAAGRGVDVAFVADDAKWGALEDALSRCRDRGLVVFVGDGPLERLDLYPDVHSRGLRLAFRSLDAAPPAGESS